MTSVHPHCDVLIIGAGLVGVTLALALADSPLRITLVESFDIRNTPPRKDEPVLALSQASIRIFNSLGLGERLRALATAIHTVHVSNSRHLGITQFSAADLGLDALGLVVPAHALLSMLRTHALNQQHIEWIAPAQLQHLERTETGYQVRMKMAEGRVKTLDTGLLVAADGADSRARRQLGIAVKTWDHQQTALMATLTVAQDHQHCAYERFTASSGLLAALPLAKRQFALVWVQDTSRAQQYNKQNDAEILQELQQIWGYRLGRLLQLENRRSLALHSLFAERQITPGAVLLGNSAHTLHPIAAQGLNLSLRDSAALAQVIREAVAAGKNPGALSILEKYASWRKPEQLQVLHFTHGLNSIFSSSLLPVKLARNAGLCALGMTTPATHWLAKQAMGLSGRLPKLACGH